MNQELQHKQQKYKEKQLYWKKFDYIDELVDWFNEHQEFEFLSFSCGKGGGCFVSVYTDKEKQYE